MMDKRYSILRQSAHGTIKSFLDHEEEIAQESGAYDALEFLLTGEPQVGSWVHSEDINRLSRELDVAMNGEDGAAYAPALCDVVAQAKRIAEKHVDLLNAVEAWLNANDTEGFGCACEPNYKCSMCKWNHRVQPLQTALNKAKK